MMNETLQVEPVTSASVVAAKQAQAVDRAAFTAATGVAVDDDGCIALRIGNAIVAAVYGLQGERR